MLPFISIRMWQPISEDETEVLSWFAVDSEAPEEFKKNSYKAYLMCFGSTGMFEQDDVENWVSLTNTAAGSMARRLLLNSRMGLLADDRPVVAPLPPEQFHGPGVGARRLQRVQPAGTCCSGGPTIWKRLWRRAAANRISAPSNPDGITPLVQTESLRAGEHGTPCR